VPERSEPHRLGSGHRDARSVTSKGGARPVSSKGGAKAVTSKGGARAVTKAAGGGEACLGPTGCLGALPLAATRADAAYRFRRRPGLSGAVVVRLGYSSQTNQRPWSSWRCSGQCMSGWLDRRQHGAATVTYCALPYQRQRRLTSCEAGSTYHRLTPFFRNLRLLQPLESHRPQTVDVPVFSFPAGHRPRPFSKRRDHGTRVHR